MRNKLVGKHLYILAGHAAGKSAAAIAKDFGVHHTSILAVLAQYGLSKMRVPGKPYQYSEWPHWEPAVKQGYIDRWMDDLEARGLIPGVQQASRG